MAGFSRTMGLEVLVEAWRAARAVVRRVWTARGVLHMGLNAGRRKRGGMEEAIVKGVWAWVGE